MQAIYSRVSTDGQSVEPQLHELRQLYPNATIFQEVASGIRSRPILHQVLQHLRDGDQLIVYSLDRLGRNTAEILALLEDLHRRGVHVVSKREGLDYSTPTGRLVCQVLVSVAELERNLISERTKVALAALKASGKQLGRRPSITPEQIEKAKALIAEGASLRAAAAEVGVSHARLSQLVGADRQTSREKTKAQGCNTEVATVNGLS